MNEVIKALKERRSVRKYKNTEVEQEKIDEIIEAGLYSPSGMGKQSTIIIQVSDKKTRDEIAEKNREIGGWKEGFDPFYNAPVILIVLSKKDWRSRVYDGSIVLENMMIAAYSLGLGTCWIHRAKEEFETDWGRDLLKSLNIDEEYEGIGHLALGYPDGDLPKAPEIKDKRVFYIK